MRITLSAAVTADGYLDDNTPRRLIVSTPGDWQQVYALRARHDAILAGAETLRRDDPALLVRDEEVRRQRLREGLRADIAKITATRSGRLDPAARFFTQGDADLYVFSPRPLAGLPEGTRNEVCDAGVSAREIVTRLEKRGIRSLLVEGGAQMLRMFVEEGMADTLRLAVNPALRLGAARGGARLPFEPPQERLLGRECVDGMDVALYEWHEDREAEDLRYLDMAVEASRQCLPSSSCYRVGAVIRTAAGELFTGYTHESSPTHHAEQEAVAKALAAGACLRGAAIYTSMEPCSQRASEPESCTQMILRLGFARVVFALYEPDRFVECRGALTLREHGVEVRVYPCRGGEVRKINGHLWE